MKGGKQPGAGRPKGITKASLIKRQFQDFYTDEDVKELINAIKTQALKDPTVMKLAAEQLFGKAPQRMELTGADGGKILIEISKEIADKHGLNASNTSPETSSK